MMLFDEPKEAKDDPCLATKARPQKFEQFLGQNELWSPKSLLFQLVKKDQFHSLIFWGPPGTGKTTLANLIAKHSDRSLMTISAVQAGAKELRHAIEQSKKSIRNGSKSIILFVDEVHRLNKAQQDIFLPEIENGSIRFIGASTENPSFEVNNAILSRSLVFQLKSIATKDLKAILENALKQHPINSNARRTLSDECFDIITNAANGDARRALNLLEAVLNSTDSKHDPVKADQLSSIKEQLLLNYDKNGDAHYDTISAFIKSIRASHPDAALYYLARMLNTGEDVNFIARRLLILASEDIGNANPHALTFATSAAQAVHMLGMPEARITLGQITTLLASSPKSNRAYVGINKALEAVKSQSNLEIPLHLRNAPTKLMKSIDYGKDYVYAHENLEGAKKSTYLPKELKHRRFYEPSDEGYEKQIQQSLQRLRPTED